MGKGDKRSRRGKIFAGSFGKTRPKGKKKNVAPAAAVAADEKPKTRSRKKAAE
jgi:30S ribosomal protein S31